MFARCRRRRLQRHGLPRSDLCGLLCTPSYQFNSVTAAGTGREDGSLPGLRLSEVAIRSLSQRLVIFSSLSFVVVVVAAAPSSLSPPQLV